jgi:hypothetical protein
MKSSSKEEKNSNQREENTEIREAHNRITSCLAFYKTCGNCMPLP